MSSPGTSPVDFAAFYRATQARLQVYLSTFLQCRDEAEDLAQDAYLRMFQALAKRKVVAPEAFLFTTARNLALNRIKRRRRAPVGGADPVVFENAASEAPGVERVVIARQEWAQMEEALAELPSGCRSVLLLRKVECLTHEEIAERLGISCSTVEKQLARALRLLRAHLQAGDAVKLVHPNVNKVSAAA